MEVLRVKPWCIFYSDLKFERQINAVVKNSFFPILDHVFVSSRLDYCNVLYLGVSQASRSRLELVQNSADRLLKGTKREHVTPALIKMHWLPIRYRIHYKELFFVLSSSEFVTDLISL